MNPTIKVFIIDEAAESRQQLAERVRADAAFTVAGEAETARAAQKPLRTLRPDLVLLGLQGRELRGLEAVGGVKSALRHARCVVLAESDAADDLLRALRAGADGYLLKSAPAEEFHAQLRKATAGVTVLQEGLMQKLVSVTRHLKPRRVEKEVALTGRESEILEYLAQGHNNQTIAHALGISLNTVKVHTKNLLVKLKLSNRLEAAMWAHKHKQGMTLSAQH